MKATNWTDAVVGSTGGDDEKMGKIVDEVDRFFKSVHADVEDWKFSMEDYGDGTRIFVRFQIHINKSGEPTDRALSTDTVPSPARPETPTDGLSVGTAPSRPEEREGLEGTREPEGSDSARRADLDLASFVLQWRRKRDRNMGAEYHKVGAPFMEGLSDGDGSQRICGDPSPTVPTEGADGEPNSPDVRS
jgi:hypothetical protein